MKFMTRIKKGHKLTRFGLALAYAGLLVLFACPLATSTLAWFSIGNYTRIRNIEFGFDPGTKLEAELKDLSSGEWVGPDEKGHFDLASYDFSFSPVSNMFSSNWYSLDLDPESDFPSYMLGYAGHGDESTTVTPYSTKNKDYISLEFRFTSDRDMYLFLETNSTSLVADKEANEAYASSYSGASAEQLNRIENACRVSFFGNMGYLVYEPNVEEAGTTYYGGRLNVRTPDGYWDTDSRGYEILYGEYDEQALSLLDYELVTEESSVKDPDETLGGVSKIGTHAITASSLSSLEEEGHIARETSYTLQELGYNAETKHPILYLPANETRRLVVSIYIEGWDKDCDSFIQAATLAANITFTGQYVPKGTDGYPLPALGKDAQTN